MNTNGKIFLTLSGIAIVVVISVSAYNRNKKKYSNNMVKSILFIGDSNTAANFSYADQLKKMYPNIRIKKIAQNGANTTWMKQQLENEIKSNKYDVVSILGGSNDIYGGISLDTTKSNLNSMYNLLKSNGIRVLAISPPNKNFYEKKTEDKQKKLFDLVSWLKSNTNKDYFIDFYSLTNDKSLFSKSDGYLHPQSKAHTMLLNDTKQKLNLA